MLLHFPPLLGCRRGSASCSKIQQQWAALERLLEANATRAIGVSNYCEECLECVAQTATVVPMVNQSAPRARTAGRSTPPRPAMSPPCRHHTRARAVEFHVGMRATKLRAYCKAHGIVLEAYSPLAHGLALKSAPVIDVANRTAGRSAAQVALKYVSQLGVPLVTSSSSADHLKDDLDLFSWRLPEADMERLAEAPSPGCVPIAPGGCCHA